CSLQRSPIAQPAPSRIAAPGPMSSTTPRPSTAPGAALTPCRRPARLARSRASNPDGGGPAGGVTGGTYAGAGGTPFATGTVVGFIGTLRRLGETEGSVPS